MSNAAPMTASQKFARAMWLVVVGLLLFAGCVWDARSDARESADKTVTMEAEADGAGQIFWDDGLGGSHDEEFSETWSRDVMLTDRGEDYRFSVSPDFMSSTTTVTCRLYVNGTLVDEASGTGSAGSARCSL